MTCVCGLVYLTSLGFREACIEFSREIEGVYRLSGSGGCLNVDIVLPGFVDLHVHMRGLEQRNKGEWRTESLAALHGGVTVVVDMPNNVPRIDSEAALREKMEEAKKESYVDFLLYTAYPYLPKEGYVAGVKLYPQDLMSDLNGVFERASKLGKVVVVHAEDPLVLDEADRPESIEDHWKAHPELAEEVAVSRVLWLAERHGTKIRIAHSTLPSTLRRVTEAKVRGINASAEVTPHHLLYGREDSSRLGSLAKVNPPLRPRHIVEELRAMVFVGLADFLATDHAPHSKEEKSRPYEEIPPGMPWLDVITPFLISSVGEGTLPAEVIDMYSSRPAQHLGIRRGSLTPGYSADLVLLKRSEWIVRGDELYTKANSTALEGVKLKYKVDKVFLRGELAYDDGPMVREGFGSPA